MGNRKTFELTSLTAADVANDDEFLIGDTSASELKRISKTALEEALSAGATGGGSDKIFWENDQTVTTDYTITNNQNAMSAGPITINSGITVTVGAGETWTVV